MEFELSDALVDQILFSMEDQNGKFVLDAGSGTVVPSAEADAEAESYELPSWGSADGFRLMEGFAASLHNPVVRLELTAALDRGRGVFRAFKDSLGEHPEVERLWFSYKQKQMRRKVADWYNALRESWGLDRIGEEPEETEDLLFEDFRFRPSDPDDAAAVAELRGACRSAPLDEYGPHSATERFRASIVAETVRGDLAGFAASIRRGDAEIVTALDVSPEYRGLGVGEELLRRLVDAARADGAACVKVDLPREFESFSRVLYRDGFAPYETRFRLDLRDRPLDRP